MCGKWLSSRFSSLPLPSHPWPFCQSECTCRLVFLWLVRNTWEARSKVSESIYKLLCSSSRLPTFFNVFVRKIGIWFLKKIQILNSSCKHGEHHHLVNYQNSWIFYKQDPTFDILLVVGQCSWSIACENIWSFPCMLSVFPVPLIFYAYSFCSVTINLVFFFSHLFHSNLSYFRMKGFLRFPIIFSNPFPESIHSLSLFSNSF